MLWQDLKRVPHKQNPSNLYEVEQPCEGEPTFLYNDVRAW